MVLVDGRQGTIGRDREQRDILGSSAVRGYKVRRYIVSSKQVGGRYKYIE